MEICVVFQHVFMYVILDQNGYYFVKSTWNFLCIFFVFKLIAQHLCTFDFTYLSANVV